MYAYIENEVIKKQGNLPKTWQLKDGRTISGFHLLDKEILKQEGWLPIKEIRPQYDAETQYLTNPQYEILEDKVIKTWQVADSIIEPQELTAEELLGQEVANLKISNIQKDIVINQLGQEITNIKLQLLGGM